MTKRPIVDRAEVGIDFPDKSYLGSFTRHSAFEAAADHEGVTIRLIRPGTERRQADIHLHCHSSPTCRGAPRPSPLATLSTRRIAAHRLTPPHWRSDFAELSTRERLRCASEKPIDLA